MGHVEARFPCHMLCWETSRRCDRHSLWVTGKYCRDLRNTTCYSLLACFVSTHLKRKLGVSWISEYPACRFYGLGIFNARLHSCPTEFMWTLAVQMNTLLNSRISQRGELASFWVRVCNSAWSNSFVFSKLKSRLECDTGIERSTTTRRIVVLRL